MNWFKRLGNEIKSLFGKGTVIWKIPAEAKIEVAFVHNGIKYYQFTSGYNMYYERYMSGIDRMNEIDMRCDKAHLDLFLKLMKGYLNKGELVNCSILIQNLEDNRGHISSVDLLYNLATVWYFTADENPLEYDYELAEKKKRSWMKSKELQAFFLSSPLMDFLPPFPISEMSIEAYIKGQRLTRLKTLRYHLSQQSEKNSSEDTILTLKSQIEELEELILIHSEE